jgi:hypothetical protein
MDLTFERKSVDTFNTLKFDQLWLNLCFLWRVLFFLISVMCAVIFVFSLISGPSDW